MRVRQVLDQMGGNGRRGLVKYLPPHTLPAETKGTFPSAILASYPDNKYGNVGLLAEELVLSRVSVLDTEYLLSKMPHATLEQRAKIGKSKTTTEFLQKVSSTRTQLEAILLSLGHTFADVVLEPELAGTSVAGHPDAMAGDVVMEVKSTSKLEENFAYFMQQLTAYMALHPTCSHGILVLPLQETVLVFETAGWPHKATYLKTLETKAAAFLAKTPVLNLLDLLTAQNLITQHAIGAHVERSGSTLLQTVQTMTSETPYQIFLSGNQSTRLNLKEEDVSAAGAWVRAHKIRLYIHAPYILNLADRPEDLWNVKHMKELMKQSTKLGALGVVLHVGKRNIKKQELPLEQALENMRAGFLEILEEVDPSCPLLLETPAGQGSEMFRVKEDYVEFLEQFPSHLVGSCLDTCHVYASGYKPSEYINFVGDRGLLRLVHYNDSNDVCGSCKDRHAFVGRGHIGISEMSYVADYCTANRIPMVIE